GTERVGIRVLFNERRRLDDESSGDGTVSKSPDIRRKRRERNNRRGRNGGTDGAKESARSTERRGARRDLRKAFYVS
ncbi:MAG: hypothetical protein IJN32_00320, partial [Thermoguttaceae bacterium]|nr:hypothetical protein [Thermoguttaceae bacterium]